MAMRNLTPQEIEQLEKQGCTAEDWQKITVTPDFNTAKVVNAHFSGDILLGSFDEDCSFEGFIDNGKYINIHSIVTSFPNDDSFSSAYGIYNATLHNCCVESYCRIANVSDRIANYFIDQHVRIENVNLITIDRKQSVAFGNGTKVSAINEGGGREITIHKDISSSTAYFMSSMRNRRSTVECLSSLAEEPPKKDKLVLRWIKKYFSEGNEPLGEIGYGSSIRGCKSIVNVNIEEEVKLEGCSRLENGTVCDDAFVGDDVIARDFIIARGAKVTDGAQLKRCYVGEGTEIGEQFAATDCFFSCNCQFFHGEAASIFAGPYSVSHHKSTLLIGMAMSFFNAGSGSNQSNHGYKLGPNNQGILERGCKLGSSSYLLWPAHLGCFTTVLGSHKEHPDTTCLPFSYLLEKNGEPYLLPAANLRSVGTMRDADKWPKRDNRKKTSHPLDHVTLDLFNPLTISQILKGVKVLNELLQSKEEILVHKGLKMKRSAAEKGLELYKLAIAKYKAELYEKRLKAKEHAEMVRDERRVAMLKSFGYDPNVTEPATCWCDMGGLIMPASVLGGLDKVNSVDEINDFFALQAKNYNAYEWNWAVRQFPDLADAGQTDAICEAGRFATEKLNALALADAEKEYSPAAMLGYGLDPECENPEADFTAVRGRFEDNSFVRQLRGE